MGKEDLERIKAMSPEERIAELKKRMALLEEEKKKEIEEATKIIKESEDEIEEKQEALKKIPIPQMKVIDINALFTPEERDFFKTLRYADDRALSGNIPGVPSISEDEKKKVGKKKKAEQDSLEESLSGVNISGVNISGTAMRNADEEFLRRNNEYIAQLSMRPAQELYNLASELGRTAEEQGYMTREQQERSQELMAAIYKKESDIYNNRYKTDSEELAEKLSIAKKVLGYNRMV